MSIQGLGTDLELIVNGKPMEGAILETIVANDLTLTAQGSSTITTTTKDPAGLLVKSDWFSRMAEAHLDGIPFKAVAFKKRVDEYSLEFEDRDFWLMKEGPHARTPVKVFRGSKTLQEFVREQVQRLCPHTNFVCPGLTKQQEREPEKIEPGKGTFNAAAGGVRIKGKLADADQLNNLNTILAVIHAKQAPLEACLAILEAGLAETVAGFASETDPLEGSTGVFQINPGAHPGLRVDTKQNAEEFLDSGWGSSGGANKLAREGKKAGEIALLVEEPAQDASFFEAYRQEAGEILKNGGGAPRPTVRARIVNDPEFFELNQKVDTTEEPEEEDELEENALSGIESYLKPGKWLFWKVGNTFYLYTEDELKRKGPVALLSEDTPGILDIGYELDHSKKKVSKVIIECRALLWGVPPGEVLAFHDSMGAAIARRRDGSRMNWLVLNIERKDITDNATTVELILPEQGKKEKAITAKELTVISPAIAPNPKTGNHESQTGADGKLLANSILYNILFQMKWINKHHYPYVWGGGHDASFQASSEAGHINKGEVFEPEHVEGQEGTQAGVVEGPVAAIVGYDCSGLLSTALHAGGILAELTPTVRGAQINSGLAGGGAFSGRVGQVGGQLDVPAQDAEWFKTWGEPGKGSWLTVWADDTHCFIEIHVPASMGSPNTEEPSLIVEGPPRKSNAEPLFFVARQKGTVVGFFSSEETDGFTPRHWPGT
jgi:hypothetical protein